MTREIPPSGRLPLLVMGMICLLVAVLAGLARLGISVPSFAERQLGAHAALMIAGFFGTVISLERAVALRRLWPYLAPLCAGLGGVSLLLQADGMLSSGLFLLASIVFTAGSVVVYRQMPASFTATLLFGAVCLLLGNFAWLLQLEINRVMPFWMSFLILTIAGERLELTRFLPPQRFGPELFIALLVCVGASLVFVLFGIAGATVGLAASFLALAVWLLRYDIARHTVKQSGLTRFVAVCLLLGYGWLATGAVLGIFGGFDTGHPWRDSALHAVFLGFVFSMVIGHAPIIFPAVMRVKIPYSPLLYLPLVVLHLSLGLRVVSGLLDLWPLRQAAAALNGVSLALFVITLIFSVARAAGAKQ